MAKSKRQEQNEIVKEFVEKEVLREVTDKTESFHSIDPHFDFINHRDIERKIDEWTVRFEAIRSIQGLSWGRDPKRFPKLDPWEGCSDFGIPIEATLIRAIIARFVKTIFVKPIASVQGRGKKDRKDTEDAKIVQEYNEYSLEDEMNFERNFYDIMLDVCLAGDGWGKLIEADEEYSWEETYFTLVNPTTGEPEIDPNTKNEFDTEWPDGYPKEVSEDFVPPTDPATGVTPIVEEIVVEKTDKTFFGTKLIPLNPKHVIVPKGADTWDVNEWPWVGHKFRKRWQWLKDREGDPKEGGYENIDKLIGTDDQGRPESINMKIPLIEVWGEVDINKDGKPKEIIALYAMEKGELLGWIQNDYRGKRMIFHWQIMPMSHRARGKSIPEFAKGIRDIIDSVFNNEVNSHTIDANPPFVFDEESGFDPEVHEFGPHEFWGVNDKTRLGRLDMGNTTGKQFNANQIIEFALGLLQRLFGVTDFTLGSEANPANKTFRGIAAIIGEGNISFDMMIKLLQMTNKRFFEANIRMHAKMMRESGLEKKVFSVTESTDNPFREIDRQKLSLNYNFIPRGNSVQNNPSQRQQAALMKLKTFGPNPLFSPTLSPTTAQNFKILTEDAVEAFELKGVKLPTQEEIAQELIKQKAQVAEQVQKKQQIEKLKATAKHRKGTPEGNAAKRLLADMETQGTGGGSPRATPEEVEGQVPKVGGEGATKT